MQTLSIVSDDRRFEFRRDNGVVSVNGRMADAEAFATLLRQVVGMPIVPEDSASAGEEPVMTIAFSCGGAEHSVRFYEGGAGVVRAHSSAGQCGATDAWRLGTLLVTCDGTRIFDEYGSELPIPRQDQ